jgi:polar amino acid transport system substrate-binding protein
MSGGIFMPTPRALRGFAIAAFLGVAFAFAHAQASDAQAASKPAAGAAAKAAKSARLSLTGVPALVRIDKSGVLRVGIAINAPFVMHDRKGEPIGYSIDIARRLAAAMGWKLELVETSWPKLMSGLRSNEYDMVVSGVSITPQRARHALFSDSLGDFDVDIVVNRERLPSGGLAELRLLANLKVGARAGELTVDYARDALPPDVVLAVGSERTALDDLLGDKLDAYVAEAPLPQVVVAAHADKLRLLDGAPLARTAHGIALRLDDSGLLRIVNAWIVYERASGWLTAREDHWFKGTSWGSEL